MSQSDGETAPTSQLPMHGGNRELGPSLVAKIKKDLGLN